jgi:hypothetical protein
LPSVRNYFLKKSKEIQQPIGFFRAIDVLPHYQQIVYLAYPINGFGESGRAILGKFRFHRARKGDLTLESIDGDSETAEIGIVEYFGFDGGGDVHVIDHLAWAPACCRPAGAEAEDQ